MEIFKNQLKLFFNGQLSSSSNIKTGVSQVSVLGPLFFHIFSDKLSENLKSTVKFFAGDTSIFNSSKNLPQVISCNFMIPTDRTYFVI